MIIQGLTLGVVCGIECFHRYFGSDASGSCGSNVDDFSLSSSLSSSSCAFRPVVYSDGCCLNNGYATARAGIGVYWGEGSAQ